MHKQAPSCFLAAGMGICSSILALVDRTQVSKGQWVSCARLSTRAEAVWSPTGAAHGVPVPENPDLSSASPRALGCPPRLQHLSTFSGGTLGMYQQKGCFMH